MITKFYSKKQLSVAAGVSRMTLYRWMLEDQQELSQMGVRLSQRILPPDAVEYVCKKHRIDMTRLP